MCTLSLYSAFSHLCRQAREATKHVLVSVFGLTDFRERLIAYFPRAITVIVTHYLQHVRFLYFKAEGTNSYL